MNRNKYKNEKILPISFKNEPLPNRYPNMYIAYKKFSKIFNLNSENFILTNGCENAFRIALLALHPNIIGIEDPTWELTNVICESFNIPYIKLKYKYNNNTFILQYPKHKLDVIYTTDTYNNLFKHRNIYINNKCDYHIIDESYTLKTLFNKNRKLNQKNIIIGGFSKYYDPGIRLGYILFDKKYSKIFNLLREQYISKVACDYIDNLSINKFWYKENNIIDKNIITSHAIYNTYIDYMPLEYQKYSKYIKTFTIDNHIFYRIGNKK